MMILWVDTREILLTAGMGRWIAMRSVWLEDKPMEKVVPEPEPKSWLRASFPLAIS
jgi:hypothetical protein